MAKSDYGYAHQVRKQGNVLVAVMSLVCLICGVSLAGLSLRYPARAAVFERWSGICLVLGLCLLGAALHSARV